jgi:hypothetical protein
VSFVYFQSSSASAPTKPSVSGDSISYNINTNTFTNLTSGWSTTPPTFAAGNSNKYWYSYFRAQENTAGGNTSSGSNLVFQDSQQGIGFSGLVTFTSGKTLSNGSTTATMIEKSEVASHIGGADTTTIDGGVINTNSITANRLKLSSTGAITIGTFTNDSGFTNDSTANAAATAAANAQTTADGKITAGSAAADVNAGSVSINANRISLTKGDIGLGNVGNTSVADIRSGTTAANVGLGNVSNTSLADVRAGVTASNVGLGSVSNLTPANQLITGFNTTITAGSLKVGNSSGARIVIDATSSAPKIEVYDS